MSAGTQGRTPDRGPGRGRAEPVVEALIGFLAEEVSGQIGPGFAEYGQKLTKLHGAFESMGELADATMLSQPPLVHVGCGS